MYEKNKRIYPFSITNQDSVCTEVHGVAQAILSFVVAYYFY